MIITVIRRGGATLRTVLSEESLPAPLVARLQRADCTVEEVRPTRVRFQGEWEAVVTPLLQRDLFAQLGGA